MTQWQFIWLLFLAHTLPRITHIWVYHTYAILLRTREYHSKIWKSLTFNLTDSFQWNICFEFRLYFWFNCAFDGFGNNTHLGHFKWNADWVLHFCMFSLYLFFSKLILNCFLKLHLHSWVLSGQYKISNVSVLEPALAYLFAPHQSRLKWNNCVVFYQLNSRNVCPNWTFTINSRLQVLDVIQKCFKQCIWCVCDWFTVICGIHSLWSFPLRSIVSQADLWLHEGYIVFIEFETLPIHAVSLVAVRSWAFCSKRKITLFAVDQIEAVCDILILTGYFASTIRVIGTRWDLHAIAAQSTHLRLVIFAQFCRKLARRLQLVACLQFEGNQWIIRQMKRYSKHTSIWAWHSWMFIDRSLIEATTCMPDDCSMQLKWHPDFTTHCNGLSTCEMSRSCFGKLFLSFSIVLGAFLCRNVACRSTELLGNAVTEIKVIRSI